MPCRAGSTRTSLVLNGLGELLDLLKGNLVLQYKWSSERLQAEAGRSRRRSRGWKMRRTAASGRSSGIAFRINEDVAALEPSIVTP